MKVINYAIVKRTLLPIRVTAWEYDKPGNLTIVQGDDGRWYKPDEVWSQSKRDYDKIVLDQMVGDFDPEQWKGKQ